MARGILVPQLGIKRVPPAVETWSLNHWTAREVPILISYIRKLKFSKLSNLAHGTRLKMLELKT